MGNERERSEATEDPTPAAAPDWFRLAQPELRLRLPGVSAADRPDVREKAGTCGRCPDQLYTQKQLVPAWCISWSGLM